MSAAPFGPDTVFEAFREAAARVPERPFLAVLPETAAIYAVPAGEIGYAEALAEVVARRDAFAAAGYGPGHRAGLLLENRPEFVLTWLALNALGVSVVPINPDLRAAELEYLIAHSGTVLAVSIPNRVADLERAAATAGRSLRLCVPGGPVPPAHGEPPAHEGEPLGPETECAVLYTSGTTGRPKGCVLANAYFLGCGAWYRDMGGLCAIAFGTERMLTPLPLFHMNAMACSLMSMIATGGCLIVLDRFHPRSWWESVRASGATCLHYLGVMPAMLMGVPDSPGDRAHAVRFGFGAGAPKELHGPFEARFGFPLIEAWAMTETGAGGVITAHEDPRHVGTACFGRPSPGVEARVVDQWGTEQPVGVPGELLVRAAGPDPRRGFFRDYLHDPDATAAAWAGGWFHTGDVVARGEDGALRFIDRAKNVIRRSGENIAAVEVEGVLNGHPRVAAAAVAPAPDPVRGDEVFACIRLKGTADEADHPRLAAEIVAHCLDRLAYYKVPGWVAFVEELPLTSTQKIQRGDLKALVAALLGEGRCHDTRHAKRRGT